MKMPEGRGRGLDNYLRTTSVNTKMMHSREIPIVILIILAASTSHSFGFQAQQVSTFTSPDSSAEAFGSFIDTVDSTLYLSVYQIDSPHVAQKILEILREGKKVTIIVEESPAGGFSKDSEGLLSLLLDNGATVYLAGDQYRFYHGKYGVSDNETLFLTTENLGKNGFPPRGLKGNRGWGVIVEDSDLSRYFTGVFFKDLNHSILFSSSTPSINFSTSTSPYTSIFKMKTFQGEFTVTPVVAPAEAVERIVSLLDSANNSIYVEQFYVYKYWGRRKTGSVQETPNPFLEHAIGAARRGVKVRILLDDTWYNVERDDPVSNLNTVLYVNEVARLEGLDLEARLIDSEQLGIEKLHTKGVVVDDKLALISSINWNENSPRNNREVGVIIEGEPARYYSDVFMFDWGIKKEESEKKPVIVTVVFISLIAIFYLRRGRK
jgi:phosphatidylserine/phosphatidylglycerophosphate/cardiolipin synthase-like enzyme